MGEVFDACIIGSGAAGGVATHVLSSAGLRLCVLEAGPDVDAQVDFKQHQWPYEFAARGLGVAGEHDGHAGHHRVLADPEPVLHPGRRDRAALVAVVERDRPARRVPPVRPAQRDLPEPPEIRAQRDPRGRPAQ